MTDAEFQGIGAQSLNMAKRDLERGDFNFMFASYFASDRPPLHRMTKVEQLVVARLGVDWLNSGGTKDIGFYVLRCAVELLPPDAVVIATVVNRFVPTARCRALPEGQQWELANSSHARQHEAVAEGLLTINDAIYAVVQTPTRVCQYVQDLNPRRRPTGQPEASFHAQEDFSGRLKMFG